MAETGKKKKKGRIILILVIVLAVIAAALFFGAKRFKKPETDDGYTETQAVKMTIENTLESDGEIKGALEENVLPHTSYYLEEINVEKGEAVPEDGVILTYTNGKTMTAPYNCVVESWDLPAEEKQLTSDHYVTIAGTDVMQMEISVSESDISKLKVGDSAKVSVEATGGEYDAEVSYISQAGTYSSGNSTFSARVAFDNDGDLKLGMSGTAVITLETAKNVIAVPVKAVTTRGGKSVVLTKSDDGQTAVEVETGISNDSFIEIKSGLSEGDTVLVTASDDSSSGGFGGMPGGFSPPSGGFPSGGNGGPPSRGDN